MIGKILLGLFVGFAIFTIALGVTVGVKVGREYNGWMNRALYSSTASEASDYIGKALGGLEVLGLTEGNYSLIHQNPEQDWGITVAQLKALRARALEIGRYPVGSMDYAESMADLRVQLIRLMEGKEDDSFDDNSAWYAYLAKNYRAIHFFWLLGFCALPLFAIIILWDVPQRR